MYLTDETIIPNDRKKLLLLLLISFLFILMGLFFFSINQSSIKGHCHGRGYCEIILLMVAIPFGLKAFAILLILFSVYAGIIVFKDLFSNRPGLILNHAGILFWTSVTIPDIIPWDDIKSFQIETVQGHKFIFALLKKSANYQSKSLISQIIDRIYYKSKDKISLPNSLRINSEELLTLCEAYYAKYGDSGSNAEATESTAL